MSYLDSERELASRVEFNEEDETKGGMWVLEQKLDQHMDEEAGRHRNMYREKNFLAILLLLLAFQSLGVVYGDLGTSPLYVFNNIFPHGIKDTDDIIGALTLIIYSLTLIPLLKYVEQMTMVKGEPLLFILYSVGMLMWKHFPTNIALMRSLQLIVAAHSASIHYLLKLRDGWRHMHLERMPFSY